VRGRFVETGARAGRDIGGDRDPAHCSDQERFQGMDAREDPHPTSSLPMNVLHAAHAAGALLHVADRGQLGEACQQSWREVEPRRRRVVVDHDRQCRRLGYSGEVGDELRL
jgi:hypothetical protein